MAATDGGKRALQQLQVALSDDFGCALARCLNNQVAIALAGWPQLSNKVARFA